MNTDQNLLNIITLKHLAQLQDKQPNILNLLFNSFLERWPLCLENIETALQARQFEEASDLLHKLKGHAGMLGLCGVYRESDRLECLCKSDFKGLLTTADLQKAVEESFQEINEILPDLTLSRQI